MGTSRRITLTKAQMASDFGQRLLVHLQSISEDGCFTLEEIRSLHDLLVKGPSELPCVTFLRRLTTEVLLDSQLDAHEPYELRLAIERVLPKAIREQVSNQLAGIQRPVVDESEEMYDEEIEPATERQLDYIRNLGCTPPPNIGKWEASDLIDSLKEGAVASNRQIMVLRFWNCLHLASDGRHAIIDWMDVFYAEDPDRRGAWELFKSEHGDDRSQRDPSWVELGIGHTYLRRVKAGHAGPAQMGGCASILLWVLLPSAAYATWKVLIVE
jgi:hypothetical protein